MARKRRLMRREITFSSASKKETDILHALSFYPQSVTFFTRLQTKLSLIQEAAGYHLRLSPEACFVSSNFKDWHWRSFNVCIPVTVAGRRRALIRFPLPHRVGEVFRPGNADEKIRCEAVCLVTGELSVCANSTATWLCTINWSNCMFSFLILAIPCRF